MATTVAQAAAQPPCCCATTLAAVHAGVLSAIGRAVQALQPLLASGDSSNPVSKMMKSLETHTRLDRPMADGRTAAHIAATTEPRLKSVVPAVEEHAQVALVRTGWTLEKAAEHEGEGHL